jgi:hypothetical protein
MRSGVRLEHYLRAILENARLVLKVAPVVVVAGALKVAFDALGWAPIDLNALLSGLVAANVFLLGFLLAGTVADYKESERLPGEVAASLETLADECLIIHEAKGDPSAAGCLAHLHHLTVGIRGWLADQRTHADVLRDVRELNRYLIAFEPLAQPGYITRMKTEQHNLRRALIRIDVIRQTSFVTAGFVVAEMLAGLVVLALLLTDVQPMGEALFFVCTITFLLAYVIALIRDLDNPFEYPGGHQGAADVSLDALEQFERRLEQEDIEFATARVAAA